MTHAIPVHECEKSALMKTFRRFTGPGQDRAFYIKDVGIVERQFKRWQKNLPTVKPFYAVKCNPDEVLLKSLKDCGTGFDCASADEIGKVLKLGVLAEDIIFANPIKSIADLKYANKVGVNKMTFDNEDELYKIKEYAPNAELVLRLLPDDSGSVMRFGVKFGAPAVHVEGLLRTANRLGLKVIGCSFHIGSGCFDPNKYMDAIALCRSVFDVAEKLGMPKMHFLDLGGGFPGHPVENERTDVPAFEEFATVIRSGLTKYFPSNSVTVIAEPGRYMATAWSTLFVVVQGKRKEPITVDNKKKFLYYINDGVYGSFNCIMFDHAHPLPVPAYRFLDNMLSAEEQSEAARAEINTKISAYNPALFSVASESNGRYAQARAIHMDTRTRDSECVGTFFGPTCDSMDVIAKDHPMEELFVGDWLAFSQMGAYTLAAASTFNGMPKPLVYYIKSKRPSQTINK